MPLKIVRDDITKMNTQAIVNTANQKPIVASGCDYAVYMAAGYDELLKYRVDNIGYMPEGEAFITPGYMLKSEYIIHVVSPMYRGGLDDEEEKLRSCYRNALQIAKENNISSISFPLISTGNFGYPKEEGMRIAVDEINAFLFENEMTIFLVVFDEKSTELGKKIYPDLESYINRSYVRKKVDEEYAYGALGGNGRVYSSYEPTDFLGSSARMAAPGSAQVSDSMPAPMAASMPSMTPTAAAKNKSSKSSNRFPLLNRKAKKEDDKCSAANYTMPKAPEPPVESCYEGGYSEDFALDFEEEHESRLNERMQHISDTFSQYLLYIIQKKGMENSEVYKRAIIDKKIFSKIKNNPNYHPQKITALCLCIGAKLNMDETKDLLARAGYALSPCDKTDIIFSYFIENEIYDMIELDIQLEEYGLPCIIA